jgi:hypothetical protein
MIHHIQTKKLTHLQQCKNPAQNIENQNTCITKKTTKQKLCFKISNHQKSHKMGLYPMTNILNPIHT